MSRFAPDQRHAGSGAQRNGAPAFNLNLTCESRNLYLQRAVFDLFLSICLTPTRLEANKLAGPMFARNRVRGRFWPEPCENRLRTGNLLKSLEECAPVLGSAAKSSRDVRGPARMRVCGGARVWVCVFDRTENQSHIIVLYQYVNGSKAVLAWFWSEPATASRHDNGGFLPISNIIAGGYEAAVAAMAVQQLLAGAGRQKFWGWRASAWADQGAAQIEVERGADMADLRQSVGSDLGVLEEQCWKDGAKSLTLHGYRESVVSLSSLARPATIAQAGGVRPPFAAAPLPNTIGHEAFGKTIELCAIASDRLMLLPVLRISRSLKINHGLGCEAFSPVPRAGSRGCTRVCRQWRSMRVENKSWSGSPSIAVGKAKLWGGAHCVNR